MGRAIVVSFEDETIRVLYATFRRKNIVVDDALILRNEQFDDFLLKEKRKEFIVVNSFKDFFQDTILVPPTKARLIKILVEAEIRKRSQFKDFSFIYTTTGEKIVQQRRMKEVFVFAVRNEDIKEIVNRFIFKGKVIKAIYPDIFSLACLIRPEPMPLLCVSETGLNKNIFLIKDGVMQFIRIAQSLEQGIGDVDIQGIKMTINYCRQALKINPYLIMLIGSLCSNYNVTVDTSIPIACLTHQSFRSPRTNGLTPVVRGSQMSSALLDFISPLSALFIPRDRDINLLTIEYKNLFRTRLLLRYSTALFLSLSIIGMVYTGFIVKNIMESKDRLSSIRRNLPDIDNTLTIYDMKKAELAGYMPFVTSFRNAASIPDIQRFLYLLSELKVDSIRIDYISINTGNNILNVELKGSVKTEGYAGMQMDYQKLINSIAGLKGVSIKSHGLDFKDKSFHIKMEYQ
ncbi:MAG: hypothetical protein QMC83_06365 [Thermodesulfovibrionales bacterium]|nr:hypothetical protein [Thermodesulfovibrionales bacterium]